jgi:hypothetical protein
VCVPLKILFGAIDAAAAAAAGAAAGAEGGREEAGGPLVAHDSAATPKTAFTPILHNPAGLKKIIIKAYHCHPAGQKYTKFMQGGLERYGN